MINSLKNWLIKYKRPLKITYGLVIICLVIGAVYKICTQTSLENIEQDIRMLSWQKSGLAVVLGAIAVVPMVIYDFIYTRKTASKTSLFQLLKDSYVINSFTNACGSGGFVGATLRVYLFGKASSKMGETIKVVSQIALFTLVGLIINDLLGIFLNLNSFFNLPMVMKVVCILFPLYIFIPFVIPTKMLNWRDHLWLLIGSSMEWLFALWFFVSVGFIIGLHFRPEQIYLAVIFAGIIGAISMIPSGAGSFDGAIILGMTHFGISTSMAVTWAFIYRVCYYIIPFLIGIVFLLITVTRRKLSDKKR